MVNQAMIKLGGLLPGGARMAQVCFGLASAKRNINERRFFSEEHAAHTAMHKVKEHLLTKRQSWADTHTCRSGQCLAACRDTLTSPVEHPGLAACVGEARRGNRQPVLLDARPRAPRARRQDDEQVIGSLAGVHICSGRHV